MPGAAAAPASTGRSCPTCRRKSRTTCKTRCARTAIDLIFLLAPTSDEERVRAGRRARSGFLYLVSLVGVTGARDQLPPDLEAFIRRVRAATDLPLAVGFGIGTPDQAARVARAADGAIVGSAFVSAVGRSGDPAQAVQALAATLRSGLDRRSLVAAISNRVRCVT